MEQKMEFKTIKDGLPKEDEWVVIQTKSKHQPKYEIAIFNTFEGVNEWYIPASDDAVNDSEIVLWASIEN